MHIVFRCDASNNIGTGHVIRCLTLASNLRSLGSKCIFISRKVPGNLNTLIRNNGFDVYELPMLPKSQWRMPCRLFAIRTSQSFVFAPKSFNYMESDWSSRPQTKIELNGI
jgi:hypothetical protein